MQKPSLLSDLVDVRRQLSLDRDGDRDSIRQRDRDIGRSMANNVNDIAALRQWIRSIRHMDADRSFTGHSTQQGVSALIAALWLIGLLSGWLLGNAALRYDGSEPVNIISALIILVFSQLTLLLLLVILLSFRLERLRDAVGIINPALWLSRFGQRLSPSWRDLFQSLMDSRGNLADHDVRRWILVYLAQHFTVALNLGVIAALLYLVTVTDLAFGWNTTLSVGNAEATSLFRWLASPWEWFLPAAAPDAELVEASRYYRLQSNLRPGALPVAELGTWWLFLLLCIVVYGLLPRLVALMLSGMRYDRAIGRAVRGSEGAAQVLARMRSPLISSVGDGDGETADQGETAVPLRRRQASRALQAVVIEWSGAEADRGMLKTAGFDVQRIYAAGGNQTVAADRALADQIASHEVEAVALVVRSWEPPMMDFVDFLEMVRDRMSSGIIRVVLLLPIAGQGGVRSEHLEGWEAILYATDDASLYVEALA